MSTSLRQLIRKLGSDKKKLSLAVMLSAMLLLLWGRLLLKQVPRTALADPESTIAAAQGVTRVIGRLMPTVHLDLPRTLERDMFGFDASGYRRIVAVQEPVTEAKSPPESPDNESEMEALGKWARGLEFQAAILGDEPTAMINDRPYRVGDRIGDFVVTEVRSRRVVLSKDDVSIRLEMGE